MPPTHAAPGPAAPHDHVTICTARGPAARLRRAVRLCVLLAAASLRLASPLAAQTPASPAADSLPTDRPAKLSTGDKRPPYEIALEPGELFQIHATQIGADVSLRLLDAAGREVARMNTPRSIRGELTLTFVAAAAGVYRLEATARDAKAAPGEYTLRREAPRAATGRDQERVAVERIYVEGVDALLSAGQAAAAARKFEEARAGWQKLGDAGMAEVTGLLLARSRARVVFFEARALVAQEQSADAQRRAIPKFEEAAKLFVEGGEPRNASACLIGAALAASKLRESETVVSTLKRALTLLPTSGDKRSRADLLLEIVVHSISLGDNATALEHLLLARPIYLEFGMQREAAITTSTIGALYYKLGNHEKALEFLTAAQPFRGTLGGKCDEVELLSNLGAAYMALDQNAAALKLLDEEARPLVEAPGGCELHRAAVENNVGKAYFNLNDLGSAVSHYKKALDLSKDNSLTADTHLNLGAAYSAAGRYDESLAAYERAASLYREASAPIKADLSALRLSQNLPPLEQLNSALKLRRDIGDKGGEALTLIRLSEVYQRKGDVSAALAASDRALSLYVTLNDRSGEVSALDNAMKVWRAQGNRRAAIFYGKQALRKIEGLRAAARGADTGLQKTYLRVFKSSYQQLAELLIREGEFEHAAQVINRYRDQQSFDFAPDRDASAEVVHLSAGEADLARRYEAAAGRLTDAGLRIVELEGRIGKRQPAADEAAELRRLRAEYATAADAFSAVLGAAAGVSKSARAAGADEGVKEIAGLREALGELGAAPGQKAVALYTLTGDENFYLLLMTPGGVRAFSRRAGAGALADRVKAFLSALSCPDSDPFAEGAALYDTLFKSASTADGRTTLEAELEKLRPDLLLWSLDEPLDAVPMAALYDAGRRQFLVERYQHAVFTRAHPGKIARKPAPWLDGIGFGTAREYTGYPASPGVRRSLSVIFDDEASRRKGIINGPALIDARFTRAALEGLGGRWPLVHIASHFDYRAGDAERSVLLLGDGDKLSLAEMQANKTLFAGVELLMLAACKTSVKRADAYGKEIDAFAELAQRLGASSVIAALWNVADLDASGWEIEFYRLHRGHQGWPKSELLRQSQLSLLRGKVGREPGRRADPAGAGRGDAPGNGCAGRDTSRRRFTPDPQAPLAHPYYWAPFVLYGGSR